MTMFKISSDGPIIGGRNYYKILLTIKLDSKYRIEFRDDGVYLQTYGTNSRYSNYNILLDFVKDKFPDKYDEVEYEIFKRCV